MTELMYTIKDGLEELTSEQRMELFSIYCLSCGADDPGCQCWNDK